MLIKKNIKFRLNRHTVERFVLRYVFFVLMARIKISAFYKALNKAFFLRRKMRSTFARNSYFCIRQKFFKARNPYLAVRLKTVKITVLNTYSNAVFKTALKVGNNKFFHCKIYKFFAYRVNKPKNTKSTIYCVL